MKRLALALLVFASGCGPDAARHVADPPLEPVAPSLAIEPGSTFPDLQVEGWVNGLPAPPGSGPKLHFVDVWAHWCPYCRNGAPNLVRLYKKYADRGVAFVGLTSMGLSSVQTFVRQHTIPWPNGYNTPREFLVPLGASSGNALFGYEIAPVVYLVAPNGKVVWTDRQARFKHTDLKKWEDELDAAIEAALAANP